MPELPEVEVIRRGIAPYVEGRKFGAVRTSGRKLRLTVPKKALAEHIVGQRCVEVLRRAKYLAFMMENGAALVIHLGMTGRLGVFLLDSPRQLHDHLLFTLDNGFQMRFNDARRFGSVQVAVDETALTQLFAGFGPEPFADGFSVTWLVERAKGRRTPVKNFLMDGGVVVGIGNIYASEILFAAGLRPITEVGRISQRRWQRIIIESRRVLTQSIACGGTTISDFVNASGQSGYFQNELFVYGREGEPCRRCKGKISREVLAGRATFWCKRCQK